MNGSGKSDRPIVCAGQHPDQEGSSPSDARIGGVISKGGVTPRRPVVRARRTLNGHEAGNGGHGQGEAPTPAPKPTKATGEQGVRREAGSERLAEKYQAVIEAAMP